MKNILFIGIVMFALALVSVSLIAAEDNMNDNGSSAIALYNDTSNIPEGMVISPAPIDPTIDAEATLNESQDASGMALGWKKMKAALTFNQEKKTQLELELAKIQLIKAKIAAKNNNSAALEKALAAHEAIMNKIQDRMAKAEKDKTKAEKLKGLNRAIQVHERRVEKLNALLTNTNLTEDQRTRIDAQIAHTTDVAANLTALQQKIKDRIAEKTKTA